MIILAPPIPLAAPRKTERFRHFLRAVEASVVRCGIKQAVQMHDEVAHLGVVDGFARLAKPGLVRLRVVRKKSDHIQLREILEINILDVMELAAKDEMNQLFWQERIFSQAFS